jgi:hypothetical protein
VISKPILFNSFLRQYFYPQERSAQAWIAIIGFLFIITSGYFISAGILRLVFPVTAFLLAVFLYLRHPILYIGFTWWIWFLSPLLTRLVDYRVGWDSTRQMLVAPYLVVFVCVAAFLRYLPNTVRQGGLPFILGFMGVF